MNMLRSPVAGHSVKPGDLLRMVGDELGARGFAVQCPAQAAGRSLTITRRDGASTYLTVDDDGSVRWECKPPRAGDADMTAFADMAVLLLTGRSDAPARQEGPQRSGLTLKGMVGRDLRARGLPVTLEVYPDNDAFDVCGEVVAGGPDANVRVNDDGVLTWERDYWPEFAVLSWEPEFSWDLSPRIGALARTIAGTIAPALSRAGFEGWCRE